MTFIDWFAGIGGFRRGMELAGHECVGYCEFDRFANASYRSMHTITDEQRRYLSTMDLRQRQKEILKDEYLNGEWFAEDVRTVNADDIPGADVWCFGFPCQDISIAGKQTGFYGNRSSLFFRVMYLLGQQREEAKPDVLFIENVKNLLSVNGGWDFARFLAEMERAGYDAGWSVLNSKHFGVPQNRERCYIIGRLRGRSGREVFSFGGSDEQTAELQGREGDPRISDTKMITTTLLAGNRTVHGTYPVIGNGGYSECHRIPQEVISVRRTDADLTPRDVAYALLARDYKGFAGHQYGNGVIRYEREKDE